MNYHELSDFEINKLVAEKLGKLVAVPQGFESKVIGGALHYYDDNRNLFSCHLEYCTNPADAWTVIIDNKITILAPEKYQGSSLWDARCAVVEEDYSAMVYDHASRNINPLRAAMEVFLMMGDAA